MAEWLWALMIIIFIDLVLAGDNAVVIAMAARRLPPQIQRKAVFWGTGIAIAVRIAMTMGIFFLLNIPLLRAIGGILLFWIAFRMMTEEEGKDSAAGPEATSFVEAIKVIVVADVVMGFDNILAIAGAAKGDFTLIIIGLLISIPVMVWGSLFILKLLKKHPWIVFLGGAILAYVGASMVMQDPWVIEWLEEPSTAAVWLTKGVLTALCTAAGWWAAKRRGYSSAKIPASPE